MKTIIAGGRDTPLTEDQIKFIDGVHTSYNITEVISGGATGVDRSGEVWARDNNINIVYFNPNWEAFGKAAGPIRNREMAHYADTLILFPGGRGTNSMYNEAQKAGIFIVDCRRYK